MSDPRLNGSHLGTTRHDLYDVVLAELLDDRGAATADDTASRNHVLVNRQIVNRSPLVPGDILFLAGQRFLIAWVGPDGEAFPPEVASDTHCLGGLSSTV
jgi:hypothetical protein